MNNRMVKDITFVLGLAALVLRRQLYLTAVDEKGLLVKMHPLSLTLLALTVIVLLLIYASVRKQQESDAFDGSSRNPSAVGHAVMALGILATVLSGGPGTVGYLGTAWRWLGLASPVCLLAAGAAGFIRKRPFFLLYVIPCLFLAVHIVSHYQTWSGNPQMQDYIFALLGAITLTFSFFYTAAMEVGCGSRRMLMGMELAAVYLCLAELPNSAYPALYFAGALWARMELFGLWQAASPGKE